jgi:hypothetical protein
MEQFTADMARQLAEQALSLDGPYGRKETEDMLGCIRGCAEKGQRNTSMCGVPIQFRDIVRRRLQAAGFKVEKFTTDNGRDPEDCYTDISW